MSFVFSYHLYWIMIAERVYVTVARWDVGF